MGVGGGRFLRNRVGLEWGYYYYALRGQLSQGPPPGVSEDASPENPTRPLEGQL